MKIKVFIISLIIMFSASILMVGCSGDVPESAQQKMDKQQTKKIEQSATIISQVEVPQIDRSIDRENIREKIIQTNDPNMLQWVYPMSAGRVIGRFPVRGKVTSGSRRLTPSKVIEYRSGSGSYWQVDAPDELGTYPGGEGNAYIFWFDPANQIHQHCGDYFLSPVPYRFDVGLGTITTEIDVTEEAKKSLYDKQTAEVGGKN